ncbi:heme-binding protein [Roseibium sp. RKSG952]|uniref:SOUL family heme-binding protein n=1 Tax=Roseibium sp. RKSG952 TaxID=2529384 RepID=UPI0012BC8A93|nr:heme-binding protein [Roseibium sp. RKSG952]MTH98284.1 heme-binding protein [Roseibium sp. RKSG952]
MNRIIRTTALLPVTTILLSVLPAKTADSLEQVEHRVIAKDESIEIRQYGPVTAAEVTLKGTRSETSRQAFNILFKYISGANKANTKIAMTAPVSQAPVEIPMTATVTQAARGDDEWSIAFYLPAQYTAKTAPQPDNPEISIVTKPAQRIAAISFSGRWTNANFESHARKLEAYLKEKSYKPSGPAVYAYFNAPFMPPPFRHNEVQIPIAQ